MISRSNHRLFFLVCVCVSLMMCKDACMEMCIWESLWLSWTIVFSVCVCVCQWLCERFMPCVWLCAQPRWLVADNNTRGRVFVDLLAEEIPTVLSVSGLCVFLRLHAWLRQLFYSPVGPLNPARALSLADPSSPSEACSSSDKGRAGQNPQQSSSQPLRAAPR